MFKETLRISWKNIIHNKMRSFLTILGVLIGVAAIIALISIVQGVTDDITGEVMDMGANKISIQSAGTPLKRGLTSTDLANLSKIDNLKGISPSIASVGTVVYNGIVIDEIIIQGRNEVHFQNTTDLMSLGRGLNVIDISNKSPVCVIGQDIKDSYFKVKNPLGETIYINGARYKIVGTLEKSSGFAIGSNDNTVIIPYTNAMNLLGVGYISSTDVYLKDEQLSNQTTIELERALNSAFNYDSNGFKITNMQNILDTVNQMTGTMSMLLAGIAAISLIVGGIGIMNMMLVTVTERTTEIGLRKALGAKPSSIQIQFILEALFLSLFGGILGLFIGIGISYMAAVGIGVKFTLVSYSIPLALGFSGIVGLIFGFAPAKKASKLSPIDALRSV